MSALDSAMLSVMRLTIGELLPDTCQIVTITSTPDGEGGQTASRATSATIACRLDVVRGRELATGGAVQAFIQTMLSLPYDTAITETQQVVHNSVTYAVKFPNTNQSWIAVKRVELERV